MVCSLSILRKAKGSNGVNKLEKMKELYGEKAGNTIHIIGYTVTPIVFGIIASVPHFAFDIDIF